MALPPERQVRLRKNCTSPMCVDHPRHLFHINNVNFFDGSDCELIQQVLSLFLNMGVKYIRLGLGLSSYRILLPTCLMCWSGIVTISCPPAMSRKPSKTLLISNRKRRGGSYCSLERSAHSHRYTRNPCILLDNVTVNASNHHATCQQVYEINAFRNFTLKYIYLQNIIIESERYYHTHEELSILSRSLHIIHIHNFLVGVIAGQRTIRAEARATQVPNVRAT